MSAPDPTHERMPRSLVALAAAGVVAIAAMALAPQVGRLDPRHGYDDAILPGTDGTAHYESPETTRRVDVQLLSLRSPTGGDAGATPAAGPGRRLLEVTLRLAAGSAQDVRGCTVAVYAGGERVDEPVAGSPVCGSGGPSSGPVEMRSRVVVSVPEDAKPSAVRVQWAPPAYVSLPAV